MSRIRNLALALIRREDGRYLFHQAVDSVKKETFYRPLGGGIEFGEDSKEALKREFQEEISQEIEITGKVNIYENIFTYEGEPGHEIVLMYESIFIDKNAYSKEYKIDESGRIVGDAVWRSLQDIEEEGAKLYPLGIEKLISL